MGTRTTSEAGRRRKVSGLEQDSGEGGRAEPGNVRTPGLLEQSQEPPARSPWEADGCRPLGQQASLQPSVHQFLFFNKHLVSRVLSPGALAVQKMGAGVSASECSLCVLMYFCPVLDFI